MRRLISLIVLCASLPVAATADTVPLRPELAGLGFLLGTWAGADGKVADTGGTSRGTSTIESQAAGAAILRRDHTDLFGADGKPSGGFEQIMLIYAERGRLRADYTDGDHVIHYTSVDVVPGHSVTFATAASPDAPSFRLMYESTGDGALALRFEMAPPGQPAFHSVATGTLHRDLRAH